VILAGCGGTGSRILTGLASLHTALVARGHYGLDVTVYDPDVVTEANIGRQNFSPADVGLHKAAVLVTRVNQFMGLNWGSVTGHFPNDESNGYCSSTGTVLITAVDSAKGRLNIADHLRERSHIHYWLDTGNTKNTGQVVLGSLHSITQPGFEDVVEKLPTVTDLYDLSSVNEEDQGPSCSLAAALEQQDLMINPIIASWAIHILWQGFKEGYLFHHGCYVDLQSTRVIPLPVDPEVWKRMMGI